jgi:hypothetical protein
MDMSNNKQNSIEWFAQKLYETLEIKGDGYVIDSLLDLAKAMHKEEIEDAYENGVSDENERNLSGECTNSKQYYNETYGNDKQ